MEYVMMGLKSFFAAFQKSFQLGKETKGLNSSLQFRTMDAEMDLNCKIMECLKFGQNDHKTAPFIGQKIFIKAYSNLTVQYATKILKKQI